LIKEIMQITVLNRWGKMVRLLLIISELVGSSQLKAAHCDTSNPALACNVEFILGVSVTHYRLKDTTSTPRAWTWLQREFPSIFGKAPPFNKGIALLVGVTNYKHLHPLPGVRNDLLRMRNYLLTEEQFDDVYILQDDDVTGGALNNLFYGYFARRSVVGEQDRFLFYYSGHGGNETGIGQMEFSEADPLSYRADANLSVNSWRDWSKILKAKQALFLFDACALGAEIVSKGYSENDSSELLRNLSLDKSRIAFAATRGGEAAHGDEDSSYFTLEFLRVVRSARADVNGVGFMTIDGIGAVMQAKLGEWAKQHGKNWYYTSPTRLDEVQYPGTFVFLNPKVPKDPESRFVTFLKKSEPPAPALPTPAQKTPSPTSFSPSNILSPSVFGPRPDANKKVDGQPASAEVRAAIRTGYDRLSEAIVKKDINEFKAVYSADFVVRNGANVKNAETYFSQIPMIFAISPTASYDIQEVVMTAQDTAVVTVKTTVNSTLINTTETDRDTWTYVRDQWLCNETNVLESNLESSQLPFQHFQNIFSLPAISTNPSPTH
jgi:hypothetical protein